MALRSVSGHRSRGTRRNTSWGFGPDSTEQTMSSSAKILGSTGITTTVPSTIIRIRGYQSLTVLSTSAGGDGMLGASGIGLVTADAFAIGITAIPGPQTDSQWEGWMWHRFWDVRTNTATLADGVNSVGANKSFEIDSKAMRKWDSASQVLVMVHEGTESGAMSVEVNADTRILIKPF